MVADGKDHEVVNWVFDGVEEWSMECSKQKSSQISQVLSRDWAH